MDLPITVHDSNPDSNVVSINVGGRIFQTTKQTLSLAGPDSLFAQLGTESTRFIDRDPDLFSVLLYILRTGNLPARSHALDVRDLIEESKHYGLEPFLIDSLSNSSQFEAFNLQKSRILNLNGRDSPSSIASTPHGGLHVAHGSKITSFDWSLRRKSTVLTKFPAVDSLLEISSGIVAAGATDFPGLQIIDLENKGLIRTTLNWESMSRSSSTVQAIGSSPEYLFTSFESSRRNANSIMIYDLPSLMPVSEINHCEIYGSFSSSSEIDSGVPSTKLRWIQSYNLLMASGSHTSPSGVIGHVRFWDVRSKNMVCEFKEKHDCFADITVSENLSAVFKVGVMSGEVFYTDLRRLGTDEDRWICAGDERKKSLNERREGFGFRIESYGDHVLCSKGSGIELWSEVISGLSGHVSNDQRVFRKNSLGRLVDSKGIKITQLAFGGNRMFVTRKDEQSIEVWESPGRGISI